LKIFISNQSIVSYGWNTSKSFFLIEKRENSIIDLHFYNLFWLSHINKNIYNIYFLYRPAVRDYVTSSRGRWAYWSSYGIFLVTYLALACCKSAGRRYPINLILLSLLVISQKLFLLLLKNKFFLFLLDIIHGLYGIIIQYDFYLFFCLI